MNSDEIRAKVSAIMQSVGVTFTATHKGQTKRDEWECDEWACKFSHVMSSQEFEFFTGLGLRAEVTETTKQTAKYEFPDLTYNDIARRTIYGKRHLAAVEKLRKPKAPHVADVLYSLILDSSAASQSFESWCAEYGYDNDSRKAFSTYEACQKNADKLARIFDNATIQALSETLQDY